MWGGRSKSANAGQAWLGLLREWGLINTDLLAPRAGDRGHHTRRSKPFRILIGRMKLCLDMQFREADIKAIFEDEWVQTGYVCLGVLNVT